MFRNILGNDSLKGALVAAVRERRVANCYLLEGESGTGKLTIARQVAAALCCPHPNIDASPCMICHSCRNILIGNHVDVIEVRPEEEGKHISVSQIRDMLAYTHVTSTESEWRVFIIDEAESMKKEAQNALLKSVEEPGKNTVFFLLTTDKTKILPTLRSRSVILRTEPLSPDLIRPILLKDGVEKDRAEEIILLSAGSLGKAKELEEDEESLEIKRRVLSYFQGILEGAGFTRLCLIFPPSTTIRKEFALFLPMVKDALRDLLCAREHYEEKPVFFFDLRFLSDLSSIISPERAVLLFQFCESLLQAAQQNVNLFSALSRFHLEAQNLTKDYEAMNQ